MFASINVYSIDLHTNYVHGLAGLVAALASRRTLRTNRRWTATIAHLAAHIGSWVRRILFPTGPQRRGAFA